MRLSILIFLLAFPCVSNAQDYYADLKQSMVEQSDRGQFNECYKSSALVLRAFPDDPQANLLACFCLINMGNTKDASAYAESLLEIDPTDFSLHYNLAYLSVSNGNTEEAKKYLLEAIKLGPDEMSLDDIKEEFQTIGVALNKQEGFRNLTNWYVQVYPTIKERKLSSGRIWEALNQDYGNLELTRKQAKQFIDQFSSQNRHDLALITYYYASLTFNNSGFPSEALEMADAGYAHYKTSGFGNNHLVAGALLNHIMSLYDAKYDGAKVITFLNDASSHIGKARVKTYDVKNLVQASLAYLINREGNFEDNHKAAKELSLTAYTLAERYNYGLGLALAANAVVAAHTDPGTPGSNAIGAQFGEKGILIADELKLDTKRSLISNLAICYYGMGTVESQRKAKALLRYQIDEQKRTQKLAEAATDLNNLGALYVNAGQWEEAATAFEEVVLLDGHSAKYTNPKDRLTFYQHQVSAYQFLVMCYARLGNAEKTFAAMEGSRARVLAERLNSQGASQSLFDLQNLLKPDEACIMYSLVSGYEVIILTVTKKYAQVVFHEDPRFIGDLKEKYWKRTQEEGTNDQREEGALNRFEMMSMAGQNYVARDIYDRDALAPKSDFEKATRQTRLFFEQPAMGPDVLKDYLYRFQKFLIVPISNRLTGIKNLLIAPDDILNFIPFEALRTFDNKYLVEKYNIRYMHSTSVLTQLQQRKYAESRKPLLAMGGAIYEEMNQAPAVIAQPEDMVLLELEVSENAKAGKSQRKAYSTLFGNGPMPYLQGTLEEVKNIANNLPGADTYLGADMTENRIKALSKSGQLSNYKVIHLATHGFVVSQISDLSGVAMCIYKDEQDGEDGFLNAGEIANLKLNADLTVLSACQTALGKLYVGEGVAGLTQSILLAGSNAALVSLWPVSDASTMLFMSNFYKEVAKGKPYSQIVNDLKKKFIKGDFGKEFTHPNYWAPFIYYGQ